MLEALDRDNLFLVPLDDRRQWYRYHHLFADVLRAHLADEQPDHVAELHRRASAWYEQNGERPEAIRHALAAGISRERPTWSSWQWPTLRRDRQEATLLGWLDALPDELSAAGPCSAMRTRGCCCQAASSRASRPRLRDAERWLDTATRPSGASAAAGWSSWTKRNSAAAGFDRCRTVRAMRWLAATWPRP